MFTWITDHKGLTFFLGQRNLSGRQARWLERISEFSFDVQYVPGVDNVLADALSRIYSNDRPGTVRAASEYVQYDDDENLPHSLSAVNISAPVYVGLEAAAVTGRPRRSTRLAAKVKAKLMTSVQHADHSVQPEAEHTKAFTSLKVRNQGSSQPPPQPEAEMLMTTTTPKVRKGACAKQVTKSTPKGFILNRDEVSQSVAKEQTNILRVSSGPADTHGPEKPTTKGDRRTKALSAKAPVMAMGRATVPASLDMVPPTDQPVRPRRKPVEPAETGRAETSAEFAKRIRRVVLHGPHEKQQEGAGVPKDSPITAPPGREDAEGASGASGPHLPKEAADTNSQFLAYLTEAAEGIDLQSVLRGRYSEDPFFKTILEDPKHYKNFYISNGLVFMREQQRTFMCIPKILHAGRSVREIVILHAHSILAHLGAFKTLNLLRDHVWWKTMSQDVQSFCNSCMTCRRSKPNNQKPYGLLNLLSVPSLPWEAIGIDFVGPLPESKDRDSTYDSITVIIDLLTGMVHLVPSRTTYKAKDVAELIFAEVYKHHGLPRAIVSDRDVLFTSTFWTHLHKLIGVELHLSSAYHPESDGSTERANRTVTQMLRQCIAPDQRDWVIKLP